MWSTQLSLSQHLAPALPFVLPWAVVRKQISTVVHQENIASFLAISEELCVTWWK